MNDKLLDLCRRRIYTIMKSSAKKRKKALDLSRDEIISLTESKCAYCGNQRSNTLKYKGAEFGYNGIDRLDSAIGYVSGNVVSCCRFCNSLKGSMKIETWAAFLRDVVKTDWVENYDGKFDENRSRKAFYGGK